MVNMRSLSLIVAGLAGLAPATADPLPGPVPAEIVRVIDGDTLRVRAAVWINQTIEVSVRLAGVDTPEIMRPECRAERIMADAAKSTVESLAGDTVQLRNIRHGKYAGRVVADIETASGEDLGAYLLSAGQAVREGDHDPWCDPDQPIPSAESARPGVSQGRAP